MVRLKMMLPKTTLISPMFTHVFLGSTRDFTALNFGTQQSLWCQSIYPTSQMDVSPCPVSWRQISATQLFVPSLKSHLSHEKKNTSYFPFYYWLVDRDPHNGLIIIIHISHHIAVWYYPLYTPKQPGSLSLYFPLMLHGMEIKIYGKRR